MGTWAQLGARPPQSPTPRRFVRESGEPRPRRAQRESLSSRGDERHEQGYVRAPNGEVPYDKDWDGVECAAGKVEVSLRLLHRVRSMVDTSR